jgi:hypothetical protein
MLRKLTLAVLGLALPLLTATAAVGHDGLPQFSRLEAAHAAGLIDDDLFLLHRFQYVFDSDKLPAEYQPDERTPIRCATPLIVEYLGARGELRPEIVDVIDGYLAEPPRDKLGYISPSGIFQLSFVTAGPNAVPSADTDPANGVPDYIERVASYLDTSWSVEITNTGFTGPLHSPYYAVSFASQSGTYGYTTVSGATTRIILENDYVGFPPNDDPDGDALGAAKVTCAHEFKHASQYITSLWSEGGWVELDATWAEDLVFDDTNDYYNYLYGGNGISAPSASLDAGGSGSYEDCIWQQWMSENWTGQAIVDLWTRRATHQAEDMLASYDAILGTRGSSITAGYPEFAAWNYACGTRAVTGLGYSEAAAYPTSQATAAATYPYAGGGVLNHLTAKNFHFTGFTPGEPGQLRIRFNGDDTATLALKAVIRRNDGSGMIESIALDGNNDADTTLSVALADLERVGLVAVNPGLTGDNVSFTLDVSRELPPPLATLSAAGIDKTMTADTQGTEIVELSNTGAPGSQLVYAAYVMGDAPAAKVPADKVPADKTPARARPAGTTAGRTAPGKLEQAAPMLKPAYAGACVFGNNDTDNIQGYYPGWWTGNESYATRIVPADYTCSCNPGFNVRAVHMVLYLETASAPQLQVSLVADNGECMGPGTILETSASFTFSGFPQNGYWDLEVPVDFACQDMDASYYLVFEFTNSAGPVGIPVDTTPQSCVDYGQWGEGWQDVVSGYGFAGDWLLWADVDCCGTPEPSSSVLSPNGGEVLAVGDSLQVDWTALVMTEVQVELSRDGGGSWEVLAASTPNDGTGKFALAEPASADCLVRVGSTDGVTTDVSDAPFWIYRKAPWLTVAPNVGSLGQYATQALTLSFDTTGMAEGGHAAWLVIVDSATSSPEVLPVNLTVQDYTSAIDDVPDVFALRGNAPNPFNPSTRVTFSLERDGQAVIDVLDLQGRLVRTLLSGMVTAGERTVEWDGRDETGKPVGSGAYLARLRSGGQVSTHKMVLAK